MEARRTYDAGRTKDLGTVRVTVDHKNRIERTTCEASLADRLRSTEGVGEVSEKDLKGQAISHSVRYGSKTHFIGVPRTNTGQLLSSQARPSENLVENLIRRSVRETSSRIRVPLSLTWYNLTQQKNHTVRH